MRSSLWMILAAFFYALQYGNVKLLHEHSEATLWPILLYRGVVGTGIALIISLVHWGWCGGALLGEAPIKLLGRGVLGALSITFSFLGLLYLRLSVATALLSSAPLWTAVLVLLFSNKEWTWRWTSTVGALVCLSGILLVFLDSPENTHEKAWLGVILCLMSSFLNALVHVALYELKNEHPWTISLYPMACTVLLTAPPTFWLHEYPKPSVGLWITGVFSMAAQLCRTKALQETRDMGVVVLRYLDVPFSLLLETLFFKTSMNWKTGVGVGMIVLGGGLSQKKNEREPKIPSTPPQQDDENTLYV